MHEDMNHVSDAFLTGIDDATHSSPALPYALIHRSAWKAHSRNLACSILHRTGPIEPRIAPLPHSSAVRQPQH